MSSLQKGKHHAKAICFGKSLYYNSIRRGAIKLPVVLWIFIIFFGKINHILAYMHREAMPHEYETATPYQEALGQSDAFLAFQERLSRVAPVDRPVLIVGERGTGKELAARRIHFLSGRWEEPLVEVNCAALTPSLIESELFGHEAGAFTGATGRREGRFEAANGGTLFLDEIGNIPLQVQEKILRAVEYGAFQRVGSSRVIQVDVRIVGATNADLPALAAEGRFMPDLLDRLSFDVLTVPPLRARQEDIMLLAKHFAARMAYELGRDAMPEFSPEVVAALEGHPWRGNIRELKNVVERAVYRTEGAVLTDLVFDPFDSPYAGIRRVRLGAPGENREAGGPGPCPARNPTRNSSEHTPELGRFTEQVEALEVSLLARALRESRYHQRHAAERLGLTYNQFRNLYRKYKDRLAGAGPGDEGP